MKAVQHNIDVLSKLSHTYLKVKFCNLKKCFEYFVFIFFWFIYIYVYACTANYLFRVVDSCKQDYVSFIKKKSLK